MIRRVHHPRRFVRLCRVRSALAFLSALLLVAGVCSGRAVADETRKAVDWSQVVALEAEPASAQLEGRDSRQQLLVTAKFADGRSQDATRAAAYRFADPTIAAVNALGVVEPRASGETQIEITIGGQKAVLPVHVTEGEHFLPLNFRRDILPILTKGGCNGGGCHGKLGGRGGFHLSLFGFDPANDYDSIVKQSRGRRLSLASPGESLLLEKPLGAVPHGGGTRLKREEPEFERLKRWIETGAARGEMNAPRVERLEVRPALRFAGHLKEQQIAVTAVYDDGSRRDVTRLTEFRSNDTSVATVDELGLATTAERTGETAIVCSYQNQVGVARIVVPLAQPSAPWPEFPVESFIDRLVLDKLHQLKVAPSPRVDDAGFMRRVSLQLAGRLPEVDELKAFLDDPASDKRAKLVDRLLASGPHADYFAQKWGDVLRNKRRGQAPRLPGTIGFNRWLRNAIAENVPYDQFVRAIVTASGSQAEYPPAQWYAEVRYLDRYVDDTAQVFLGVRIGCARCHNHPFEKFTQEDYYGLAAFFARVDRKGGAGVAERRADETIFVKATGEVKHPLTGQVVPPHGLDGPPLEIAPYDDPRQYLVDWMCQPDNPYLSRAFVNRMWAHFFGRGLVEPMDDLRVTNPAVNEPLLDELAAEFVRSGFDMRHLLRLICTSTTYQLSSLPNADNLDETQCHSRFYPQRLSAEVLLDAIDSVTRSPTRYGGLPDGTRAISLPDEGFNNSFLKLFGRPPRESACECERIAQPNLAQALHLMNDPFVSGKLAANGALADQLAKDKSKPEHEKVEELFLAALARPPRADELSRATEYLATEKNAAIAYRNLLWAVLNTKEFLYVH